MTSCEIHCHEVGRRSTRTGHTRSSGGFAGGAEYESDLAFLPYLEAARWVGVGRQAVWGSSPRAARSVTLRLRMQPIPISPDAN